jgi:hypothetical protein
MTEPPVAMSPVIAHGDVVTDEVLGDYLPKGSY